MSVGLEIHRILVIDDNPAIHADFRKVLLAPADDELNELASDLFGVGASGSPPRPTLAVDTALQGQEGYNKVREALSAGAPYALAFVDMRMPPGWDGLETIKHLWELDPDLQVVICTAYSDRSWPDVVSQLGGNDRWLILKKPFDNAEVSQLAAALIGKRLLTLQSRARLEELETLVQERTAALREREAHVRAIVDTAPDGIITCDEEGVLQSFNQAAAELFQYRPLEIVGQPMTCLMAAPHETSIWDQRAMLAEWSAAVKVTREFDCIRRDGVVFPALWTCTRTESEERTFFTAIVRDQTEHKKLLCDLTQAQKLEAVGQLAAGIAHEINTPTQYVGDNVRFLKNAFGELHTALQAYAQMLSEPEATTALQARTAVTGHMPQNNDMAYLTEEIPKTIEQTLDGVGRIASIVRAMKEFSHPGTADKVPVDLHPALDTTITVARNEWKHVADVVTDYDRQMPPVPCLAAELNQVFLNLLINAAHAIADSVANTSETKGTITIRTRQDGAWASIEFSDTGTGIPEGIRKRIFDPFFTTKPVGKGTGQGLAISRSVVVDKHHGAIDVQSEVGKGSTFRLRLPLLGSTTECRHQSMDESPVPACRPTPSVQPLTAVPPDAQRLDRRQIAINLTP